MEIAPPLKNGIKKGVKNMLNVTKKPFIRSKLAKAGVTTLLLMSLVIPTSTAKAEVCCFSQETTTYFFGSWCCYQGKGCLPCTPM